MKPTSTPTPTPTPIPGMGFQVSPTPILLPLVVKVASEPPTIDLDKTSKITVTVVDTKGEEISNADVVLSSSPTGKINPVSGQTNSFGQFISTFTAPAEGKVTLKAKVRKEGFIEGSVEINIEIEQLGTPTQGQTQTPIPTSTPPNTGQPVNFVSIIAVLLIITGLLFTALTTIKKDISLEVGVSERSLKYVGGAGILLIIIGAYILLKSYGLI